MQYSRYNHLVEIPDENKTILYNVKSGALIKLNSLSVLIFNNALKLGKNTKGVDTFIKGGFILESEEDEFELFQKELKERNNKRDTLNLTICPATACNFDCIYCYEKHNGGIMSRDVQDKVIIFIKNKLKENKYKKLKITWYGGEPLLAPEVIEYLAENLAEFCEKNNIEYDSSIITNGYYFDPKNVKLLERSRVTSAQLTLDGPDAETHDKTRFLKNGKGSFEKIINNLENIKTDIKIEIRCNIHKENIDGYKKLEEKAAGIAGKNNLNIFCYPALMDGEINATGNKTDHLQLTNKDISDIDGLYSSVYIKEKMKLFDTVCVAQQKDGYVIDDRGNLFKCWEHVCEDNEKVGSVETSDTEIPCEKEQKYLDSLYTRIDNKCVWCKLYPICLGGCPKAKLQSGHSVCTEQKYLLDKFVIELSKGEEK